MTVITLDWETYFDSDYTLRKLTTEGYIRDPRFEALCLGVKYDERPAVTIPATKTQQLRTHIGQAGVVCHHAHFDGLILSHHIGLRPRFWFDTLSMARVVFPHDKSLSLESLAEKFDIGHKTVPYEEFKGKRGAELDPELYQKLMDGCAQDVELTHKIFKKLLPLVPKEELKVIDMTVRMFTEPVLWLDKDRARVYMENLQREQEELLRKLNVTKEDLGSADKFAALLESYGIDPPTKTSPRTGKKAYAFAKTDQGFLELVNHEQEEIRALAEARLNTKSTIGETRAGRLLSMAERGNLCVYLKYFGAHTGRWSGGDKLNFQNFPRGGELRKSLLAPDGYVLCVADLSQIECRMLNYLAREDWVLKAFKEGRDLYCEMATAFYGRTITKADKKERFLGKTLVLGCGYGVGWKKLQGVLKLNGIELSDNEAQRAVNTYRSKHTKVAELWKHADWILSKMYESGQRVPDSKGFECKWGALEITDREIYLPNGVCLDYGNLDVDGKDLVLKNPKGTTKIYGGKLIENVVQALSRVVMSQAMLKIGSFYKVVLTCHDEIVYLAPEEEADIAMEIGLNLMKQAPLWCKNLPLDAEGGYAREYSK